MSTASLSCGESFDECRKSKQAVDTPPTPRRGFNAALSKGLSTLIKAPRWTQTSFTDAASRRQEKKTFVDARLT